MLPGGASLVSGGLMKRALIYDFETASAVDLKACGAWRYAEDLSTEVLSLSWGFCGEMPRFLIPSLQGTAFPPELQELLDDPDVLFTAHNCSFEKAVWRRICVAQWGWPDIPNSRIHDTMATAHMKALPPGLDEVTRVLGLQYQKDKVGNTLTIGLSKINKKTGMFPPRTPEVMARVVQYNKSDIDSQGEVHHRLGWQPAGERNIWLLNQRINERGFKLDMALVHQAQKIVAEATIPLAAEFRELTGGLSFTQGEKIKDWCYGQGVSLPNLQKETVTHLLGRDVDGAEDEDVEFDPGALYQELPAGVRRALEIRAVVGSASVKKLDAMERSVGYGDRVRGTTQYHGAATGREAGRLLQPTNFPRGSNDMIKASVDDKVTALMTGDWRMVEMMLGVPAVEAVIGSLRHMIYSEDDRTLMAGDYAQIEARIVLAAAGQYDKCKLLASGADPYVDMAMSIYPDLPRGDAKDRAFVEMFKHNYTVQRQHGKNSVLGMGFGMGPSKFRLRYCPDQPLEFAEQAVSAYREDWAPEVPKLWKKLEWAALDCVWEQRTTEAAGAEFCLEDGWLTMRLPSGRKLWYWNPQPVRRHMPWSTAEDPDVRRSWTYQVRKAGRWATVDAYGGLITENYVQGLARDLLWNAAFKVEAEGLPIVLTVYDEILTEPKVAQANEKLLTNLMEDAPDYARAMQVPVAVECWTGRRYKK